MSHDEMINPRPVRIFLKTLSIKILNKYNSQKCHSYIHSFTQCFDLDKTIDPNLFDSFYNIPLTRPSLR